MSILYTCYSVLLMKFLTVNKGLRYELVACNPNTMKEFWIFVRNEELNKALDEWSAIR